MATVHRTRRRPLEVNALNIVPTAMTRTFELILARLPVWSAAQVCATREDDEEAIGSSVYPDAIRHLVFLIYPKTVIRWKADAYDR